MASRIPTASGLYKYTKIATNSSNYAKRMQRLSDGIFGELTREKTPVLIKTANRFAVKPKDLDPDFINYYPRHVDTGLLMAYLRNYGLFRDEHQDFSENMKNFKRMKGKTRQKGEKKKK